MKILTNNYNLQNFLKRLKLTTNKLLLLDYDGTLAPFKQKRDEAFIYPEIKTILEKLINQDNTKVIIITGRKINEILKLLDTKTIPEIWGSHGAEKRLSDGTYETFTIPNNVSETLKSSYNLLVEKGFKDQAELKLSSLAIHWRGLNEKQKTELQLFSVKNWQNCLNINDLNIQNFDNGVELRYSNINKGIALRKILDKYADTQTLIAYLGDDNTDEDAFEVLQGKGLNVLVREEFRPTKADLWISPPSELKDFLSFWLTYKG